MYDPKDHPNVNRAELDYLAEGGALVNIDQATGGRDGGPSMRHVKALLKSRMLIGVYVAQYCINALTYFFITWFPVYLVQARGMSILNAAVASIPAVCGFLGGILGGVVSDGLLKQAARCRSRARCRSWSASAVDVDDRLQLHRFARARRAVHGAVVLRQAARSAGPSTPTPRRARSRA